MCGWEPTVGGEQRYVEFCSRLKQHCAIELMGEEYRGETEATPMVSHDERTRSWDGKEPWFEMGE